MPRAPQLDQQVANAPLPGVRIGGAPSPESYGAGVGALTSRVGMALYEQEALNADRTSVFEADRQAAELQTSLEQKLRGLKGKNVLGADEILRKEWDDGITKIESGLSTERQRAGFARTKALRGDQLNRLTQAHVATEFEHFQDQETDAGIKSVFDRVRANPGQPEVLAGEMQRANSLIAAAAQRKGLIGTVTEAQIRNPEFRKSYEDRGEAVPSVGDQFLSDRYSEQRAVVASGLHSAVINGFLAKNDDLSAKRYFEAHANDLVAADRQALEKVVMEGSTVGHARRIVNGWIDKGYNEIKMLEEARLEGAKDPKLGDLLRNYSVQYVQDKQAAEKRVDERNFETVSQFLKERIAKEPGVYHDPRTVLGLDKYLALSPQTQDYLDRVAREAIHPGDRPNDDPLWLNFLAMKPEEVANLSRQDFELKYWQHFDNGHRSRAEAQWNTYRDALARKDGRDADPKVTASLTFKDQVNNAWALSGLIDPAKERSKWSTEEMKSFVRFEDQAAQALQHYELTKLEGKRHATPDEVREVVKKVRDQAVQKVFTPGWFGAKERPAISLEEDERKQAIVPVDKIPADSLGDLRNYIRSKGKTITEDKLRRSYAQYVLGNRQAFDSIIDE